MKDPQEYIEEQLRKLSKTSSDVPSFKNEEDLVMYITKAVLSKKFRKYAVDDELHAHLQNVLKLNLERNEPIKFVMPFGGYKLWRLAEAPEVDWAELFSMMFYTAWLKPITDTYKPGVWFDFSSDDVVVERLNNIPKSDTKAYMESFNRLIVFLKSFIPENINFTFTPVGSRYTETEFNTELDSKIKEFMDTSKGILPTITSAEVAMIDLNVRPTENQLKDPHWHQKNKVMHDAYMTVSKRRPYTRTEDKILTFTRALPKGIAVGTTKTSIAKFWVGVGALKRREESYIEMVLSPEQIRTSSVTLASINLNGLEGKNFKKIRIID